MANAGFENAIKNYLDKRAESDRLFAVSYKKENKSIQECCKYIYSQAKKLLAKGGNAVGVDDDTVYGWAVHYYDEDDIKVENVKGIVETVAPVEASVKLEKTVEQKPIRKKTKQNLLDERQLSLFGF